MRVDFLMTNSGPKFSELTPYSHGGNARFTTQAAGEYLAGCGEWVLPGWGCPCPQTARVRGCAVG